MQYVTRTIESRHNPLIKRTRSLLRRNVRQRERVFIAEGPHLLLEASRRSILPTTVFVAESFQDDELEPAIGSWAEHHIDVIQLPNQLFRSISDAQTPAGILATFEMDKLETLPPSRTDIPLFLIADDIRDPGNLGTMMRTGLAAGVHGFVLSGDSVDPFNPKVIRAGMGAHFGLPLLTVTDRLTDVVGQNVAIVSAEGSAEITYDQYDWTAPSALVIGNETRGVRPQISGQANYKVRIPMYNDVESLNAGSAASIVLFEAQRQRRT